MNISLHTGSKGIPFSSKTVTTKFLTLGKGTESCRLHHRFMEPMKCLLHFTRVYESKNSWKKSFFCSVVWSYASNQTKNWCIYCLDLSRYNRWPSCHHNNNNDDDDKFLNMSLHIGSEGIPFQVKQYLPNS